MSAKTIYGYHTIDFNRHNAEVNELWEAYRAGNPPRAPIILGINPRLSLQDPKINVTGTTFKDYILKPEVMFETQLRHQYHVRHHIPQDQPMGIPDKPAGLYLGRCDVPEDEESSIGWTVYVDFQNVYEGAWLGCPIEFSGDNEPPFCVPFLNDDNRNLLFDRGIPDPIKDGGWMERNFKTHERLLELADKKVFKGCPVNKKVDLTGMGTDGLFTIYCELRGAENACLDIAIDTEYFHKLMDFITEATIIRLKAFRKYCGEEIVQDTFAFADDSIELLSTDMYREHVLPYHKRLFDTFTNGKDNSIHLCGNASRLFKLIKDELNVMRFDTGFPLDHGAMRKELGPEVEIFGGPRANLFVGTSKALLDETKRILDSGVREGKKFVLREGNNLPPRSQMSSIWEFYFRGCEWGKYHSYSD